MGERYFWSCIENRNEGVRRCIYQRRQYLDLELNTLKFSKGSHGNTGRNSGDTQAF